ncbi:hypothetical protein EVAR_76310_1 [Eumeta japonica]|uniref:Uncharacterized protein n=1 Tax=Eumeta variegata TaxID=151549 RepID=A0A4C1T7G9_EUMVA|nr:hypothetical protein EVAR_76310_1 [Eumeta japonica]
MGKDSEDGNDLFLSKVGQRRSHRKAHVCIVVYVSSPPLCSLHGRRRRGGWLCLDIGAARENCYGEVITCAMRRSIVHLAISTDVL